MDGAILAGCECGFLDRFAEGRVRMADPTDVFGGCAVFHSDDAFGNEISATWADHVYAEYFVGFHM